MKSRRRRKPLIQKETSERADGNINLWARVMGKYGWNHWYIVAVIPGKGGIYGVFE